MKLYSVSIPDLNKNTMFYHLFTRDIGKTLFVNRVNIHEVISRRST